MRVEKSHIQQLPIQKIKTHYPRNSDVVGMVLPLFHTSKGWVGNFDEECNFDWDMFQDVVCKGAVWAAISVMENTDLCQKGMPIYFHVEDKVMDKALEVFDQFGVPPEWIVETTFDAVEDSNMFHPLYGKKYSCFMEAYSPPTNVVLLWDTDAFVYRAYGDQPFEWYQHFQEELSESLLTSYHSTDIIGELSYVNWLRRGVGQPDLQGQPTLTRLMDVERETYEEIGLNPTEKKARFGAAIMSLPKDHALASFLVDHYAKSYTCESPLSMWLNSVGMDYHVLDEMFLPFEQVPEQIQHEDKSCIAHFYSGATDIEKWVARFKRGIGGHNATQVRLTGRSRKRFHVIPVPHYPTHKDFNTCPYVQKARKLCYMLDRSGHEVYHYGNELSEVQATENVVVTTENDLIESYGDYKDQTAVPTRGHDDYAYKLFFLNTEHELRKRAKADDFICYVFAPYLRPLYDSLQDLPVHHVESGVGYYYAYMPYRVFESPAVRDFTYGVFQRNYDHYDYMTDEEKRADNTDWNITIHHSFPQWQDCVIPNSFDVADFRYETQKDDYFLYVGRIMPQKGIEEAMRIADACGKKLLIAGQGDFREKMGFEPWANVELLGPVGVEERQELMAKAKLGFCLSHYPEPFCGTHIEFALSGTPVITSQFGVFAYTVKHGKTGYRVTNFEQGVWAARNIDRINPEDCREHGLKFSNENVALKYDEYFDSLLRYIRNGKKIYWFENPDRKDLDWLND